MGLRICGIIVTYFPSSDLLEVVEAIRGQVSNIVIVDNGSGVAANTLFEGFQRDGIEVVRNPENLGIAAALNIGVARARDLGSDWVLTLDQDSVCDPGMVQSMMTAYRELPESKKNRVGVLAPVYYARENGYVSSELRGFKRGEVIDQNYVMTSGNLIPILALSRIGPFADDFFIDYVDHDFCLRAKKCGYRVLLVADARMGHRVGNLRNHFLFGRFRFFSYNYSAERHYYRYRNRVKLYWRHFGSWVGQDQGFALRELIKLYLVESDRWVKTKAIIKGAGHGILGRSGRIDGVTFSVAPYKQSSSLDANMIPQGSLDQVKIGLGEPSKAAPGKPSGGELNLHALFQLDDPEAVIKKSHALLRPGGRLLVAIPPASHKFVVGPVASSAGRCLDTNLRSFTKKDIVRILKSSGFEIKTSFASLLNKLTIGSLADILKAQEVVVCCKKET